MTTVQKQEPCDLDRPQYKYTGIHNAIRITYKYERLSHHNGWRHPRERKPGDSFPDEYQLRKTTSQLFVKLCEFSDEWISENIYTRSYAPYQKCFVGDLKNIVKWFKEHPYEEWDQRENELIICDGRKITCECGKNCGGYKVTKITGVELVGFNWKDIPKPEITPNLEF